MIWQMTYHARAFPPSVLDYEVLLGSRWRRCRSATRWATRPTGCQCGRDARLVHRRWI